MRRHDERGVSSAVSQVLAIGITAILVTGVLFGASGFINDERERAAERELGVVGERMASELEQLDRVLDGGSDGEATVATRHPRRVAGLAYTVTLTDAAAECGPGGTPCLVLRSNDLPARTVVAVRLSGSVSPSTVAGGRFQFVYDPSGGFRVESGVGP